MSLNPFCIQWFHCLQSGGWKRFVLTNESEGMTDHFSIWEDGDVFPGDYYTMGVWMIEPGEADADEGYAYVLATVG